MAVATTLLMCLSATAALCYVHRVDQDSPLHSDLQTYKEKEGKDFIQLCFTFKVNMNIYSYNRNLPPEIFLFVLMKTCSD